MSLTQDKNSHTKITPTRAGGEIGEKFSRQKFPAIQYIMISIGNHTHSGPIREVIACTIIP